MSDLVPWDSSEDSVDTVNKAIGLVKDVLTVFSGLYSMGT